MPLPYGIDMAGIQAVMSAPVFLQIFDDDNDGAVDDDDPQVERLLLDAISYVEGFVRRVYSLTVLRAASPTPNELVRLIYERAQSVALFRHPEVARFDAAKLQDRNRKELMDLAEGRTRLDVDGSPEPAANEGGSVTAGSPDVDCPPQRLFGHQGESGLF